MKKSIYALQILLAASCMKEGRCPGAPLTCTHTIYDAYRVCPDPKNPNQLHFSDCKSHTETFEVCAGDTSAWLAEARAFNENRKVDPESPTWEEFARIYPNECGCK